ncbi:MAG: periplasmic heavy metal sensor [Bacteroidales bacterium]|nr:periplasmic heavy metal sensor [Bacteroidales bacterium]
MRKIPTTVWILLVVLLLGSNIAFIATYRTHRARELQQEQDLAPDFSQEQDAVRDVPPKQFGNRLIRELDLNDQQQEQFRKLHRSFNRSANGILRSMEILRSGMAEELNSPSPDKEKLERLASELGEKHKDLKMQTFLYYFQMKDALDPEQQEKFAVLFRDILAEPGTRPQTPRHRGGRFRDRP